MNSELKPEYKTISMFYHISNSIMKFIHKKWAEMQKEMMNIEVARFMYSAAAKMSVMMDISKSSNKSR